MCIRDRDDGSILTLNTDSAADVRFDAGQRLVILRRGELHVASHPDARQPPRPLRVVTPMGQVTACLFYTSDVYKRQHLLRQLEVLRALAADDEAPPLSDLPVAEESVHERTRPSRVRARRTHA